MKGVETRQILFFNWGGQIEGLIRPPLKEITYPVQADGDKNVIINNGISFNRRALISEIKDHLQHFYHPWTLFGCLSVVVITELKHEGCYFYAIDCSNPPSHINPYKSRGLINVARSKMLTEV